MSKVFDLQLNLEYENGEHDDPGMSEGDVAVAPVKAKLKPPSMYQVIMLNDDYTPMDFVVDVLEIFFNKSREQATRIMLAVHTQGKAVCGVFTKDVAETKAAQVNHFAQESGHPLVCEIEVASDQDQ